MICTVRWERSILKNIWITHRQSILTCLIWIEKLRGDIEILKQEIDGGDDEAAEEDIEDIEE